MVCFHSNSKGRQCQKYSNYCTIALISHASKVMLKILKVFSDTCTENFQMFKLVLEKAEEPEIKLPTSAGSSKMQESSRKTSISALLICQSFDCVDHNKLWKILKEMGISDHLTCLLRNLYAGHEASYKWPWTNRLVPNKKRNMSRLYIVTLLI